MKEITTKDIAEYFDVGPELVPYIPELLSDIWALGSSPKLIVDWLRSFEFTPMSTQVLDLGCGKGAVSITIAKELGFHIYGIDFFEPFVLEARRRSKELGVSRLCGFEQMDIRLVSEIKRDFTIVIYTAVGGVLGTLYQCVEKLRQFTHSGGIMIIDDGFCVTNSKIDLAGYEYCLPYRETIKQLTSHGDTILKEKILSFDEVKLMNQRDTEFITKRAKNLVKKHPELTNALTQFLEKEKRECEILGSDVASAVWLLQKI
jgi:SAM-dependent methyltransferase